MELDTVENTFKFQKALRLFRDATSLGGYDSLIDYRYRYFNMLYDELHYHTYIVLQFFGTFDGIVLQTDVVFALNLSILSNL